MKAIIGSSVVAGTFLLFSNIPHGGAQPPLGIEPTPRSSAYAVPVVEIVAPDTASYGKMVVATAKLDKSKLSASLVKVNYQWAVLYNGQPTSDYIPWPDNSKVIVGVGVDDAKYTFILHVDCLYGVSQKVKIGDKEQTVYTSIDMVSPDLIMKETIVGKGPTPNPNPTPPAPPAPPNPPAPPVLPDGKYKLAQFAFSTITGDATLTAPQKVLLAKALSSSFGGVAANIAAVSTFPKDINGIMDKTKTSNEQAIAATGISVASTAAVKKALGDNIYNLIYGPTPQIKTGDDVAVAWREIASGCDAVK